MDNSLLTWFLGGGFLTIVIFSIGTYVKTGNIKEEVDKKIDRNYQRLDENKEKNDIVYTKKDVCEVVHKNVDNRLEKIEKLTENIPAIKIGVDLLLKKNGLKND